MLSLESLFCHVDDFCQEFEPQWQQHLLGNGLQQRRRSRSLCMSEMMTILIAFHQSAYRNFKWFYTQLVCRKRAQRLSQVGELQPLCRMDAIGLSSPVCLLALLLWQVYGGQFHRCNEHQGVSQPPHYCSQSVQIPGSERQNLSGLVLWVQVAFGNH